MEDVKAEADGQAFPHPIAICKNSSYSLKAACNTALVIECYCQRIPDPKKDTITYFTFVAVFDNILSVLASLRISFVSTRSNTF